MLQKRKLIELLEIVAGKKYSSNISELSLFKRLYKALTGEKFDDDEVDFDHYYDMLEQVNATRYESIKTLKSLENAFYDYIISDFDEDTMPIYKHERAPRHLKRKRRYLVDTSILNPNFYGNRRLNRFYNQFYVKPNLDTLNYFNFTNREYQNKYNVIINKFANAVKSVYYQLSKPTTQNQKEEFFSHVIQLLSDYDLKFLFGSNVDLSSYNSVKNSLLINHSRLQIPPIKMNDGTYIYL